MCILSTSRRISLSKEGLSSQQVLAIAFCRTGEINQKSLPADAPSGARPAHPAVLKRLPWIFGIIEVDFLLAANPWVNGEC